MSRGLPLEIYCFSNDTVWTSYEGLQSDIFEHLLAVLPEFGLRAYQQPSGADVQTALGPRRAEPESQPVRRDSSPW
jgi:miniconductance mechanosensitive channel